MYFYLTQSSFTTAIVISGPAENLFLQFMRRLETLITVVLQRSKIPQ